MMDCIYIAQFYLNRQSTLQGCLSFTNSLWVKYLAQGHFDMSTGGAGERTTNIGIKERPALPSVHQNL